MMSKAEQETEKLIETLSDDLVEVKVMPHPIKRVALWVVITFSYAAIILTFLSIRPDLSIKLNDPNFVFELIHILSISISAMACSSWLCVPDMRGQRWMLAVPTTLLLGFVIHILLRSIMEDHNLPFLHVHHCITNSTVFGVIPALIIIALSIKGKTTHPYVMSFMNTMAVGGLGYLGMRVTCMSEDIGHLYAYHLSPYILFAIVISLVGRRIYRW